MMYRFLLLIIITRAANTLAHASMHAHIHRTGPPENVQRMLRIHTQMGFCFFSAVNVKLKSKCKIRLIGKKRTPLCC